MHEEPVRVPVRCEAAISRRGFVVCAGALMSPMGTYAAASLPPADRPDARLLQRDIDILQSAYERLHPGLYRYNSPAQISAGFDVLRQEMLSLPAQGPWLDRAYLAFARFAAKVRCGHTYANFYNQSDAVRKALFERADKLPAEFRWIDSRMLVTRDLSHEQALPPGTFIVAVNGVPVDVLLLRLLAVARADGSNDAKRVAQMELQGIDRHEAFDVYLPLVAPGGEGKIELEVRQPQRLRRDRLAVRPLTYEERLAARRVSPRDERAGWTFDSGDAAFAMLKMPNWALYDSKWDWKAFIADCFEQLATRQPRALVIDLRGNEGGLDVGDEILPHLIASELAIDEPPRLVRYRDVPVDLDPYLDTWDKSFKHWGDEAIRFDERFYALRTDGVATGPRRIAPRTPHFPGKVFVLIGPDNSSATFQFAQSIRASNLGTLVGRPTGGNMRGINGGAFFFLRLPGSGLELDLPLIARFPGGSPPDAGLVPDIEVVPGISDILAGRDLELSAVRAQLKIET